MVKKTGSRLVISTLAVAALWAASAGAEPGDFSACYEEYNYCVERANEEPEDWIRDYSLQQCYSFLNLCFATIQCGDGYCDQSVENNYYCPTDCH
ncbi:hypothetical protein D187_003628 [Cystobacter fuscus DSM 2262]|uniref:Lipoprotein n=1 Tax=Cystobacter fuscus (strain ATCC 25194 / DSM 2262 / NBRC 100088 / M29) TaxID=1242864 RepID=S9QQM5_CYSF2|nr:hypothetical protein [Cystobacter fuscus]EPX58913.1 hypothetical protein D187_003628 [Cystobacter fuscus DSM 2262]